MKTKRVAKNDQWDSFTRKIVKMCFDPASINNFSVGLKMIYAVDDPPLFVTVEEVDLDRMTQTVK